MSLKAAMITLIILVFMFVWQARLSVYSVEEALTVVFCIAVLLLFLLLPVMAFLLLWHGARFLLLRLKDVFALNIGVRVRPRALHGR